MTKIKIHNFIYTNALFLKFIYGLIILNVISIIIASYKEVQIEYNSFLEYFEIISVIIFTIEYILRVWTADLNYEFGTKFSKRLKYITSAYGLIDLFAILPFYLPFIITLDLRVLRILRLFRLLRIFKLGRLSKSLKTINSVLKDSKAELSITIFVAFILLILSSTLMYYVENEAQPEKFENIGQAMWWAVATLTTVGYGDVYPVTAVGKLLSALIALIGIGFVALPTGIISSSFISRIQKDRNSKKSEICKCPKCGTEYNKNE